MKQVIFTDAVQLRNMIQFAINNDCEAELARSLLRLLLTATSKMAKQNENPGSDDWVASDGDTLAVIGSDFAAHSLRWAIFQGTHASINYERGKCVYNGGFIYEGPGQPLDGSFPALTVSLSSDPSKHSWGVHT